MSLSFFSMTLILFLIMDAFGNASSYEKMLESYSYSKRYAILFREYLFGLGFMLLFNLFGEYFLQIFHLSIISVNLCSGLILFLFSLKVLFPSANGVRQILVHQEPFIIPIAVPLLAGPALLATIMLFSLGDTSSYQVTLAILISWTLSLIAASTSFILKKYLGESGLGAIEKFSAMILIMLAIQRFVEGIKLFITSV